MSAPRRHPSLSTLAFVFLLFGACKDAAKSSDILSECPAVLAESPAPDSISLVEARREKGATWTDGAIRARYVCWVSTIAPADAAKKAAGVSAEARAHSAYELRKEARLSARAMMTDRAAVEGLRARDAAKYGNPDGPTFDWLVAHAKEKGKTGDAVFEEIVESAQRTDQAINERFGL